MKKAKLIWILILIFALVLAVYLVASLMKQQAQREMLFQTRTQPSNSNTNVPKSLTEYQACLDRVNNSEAEESLIEESRRECETLYKP